MYNLNLEFGFFVSKQTFLDLFKKTTEGSFHWEDRFDPKTGLPVTPEKVWDIQPTTIFEIEGYIKPIIRIAEFLKEIRYSRELSSYLRCRIRTIEGYSDGSIDFCLELPYVEVPNTNSFYYGNGVNVGRNCFPFEAISQLEKPLSDLKEKLLSLKIPAEKPFVFIQTMVGSAW